MTTEATMTDDETETDELAFCETCETELAADHDADEFGDQCQACYAKTHFHCLECECDYDIEDRSAKNKCLCQSCQDSKDEELAAQALAAAQSELQELVDGLDDIELVRRAIKALKRLQA